MAWFQKDPSAVLAYVLDWSKELGVDDVATSSWAVTSGVTKDSDTFSDTATTIWLSGGTSGSTYTLTNTITTDAGRTLEKSVYLEVVEQSDDIPTGSITTADIVRLAHRKIGVVSAEQSVSADQDAYAQDVLQGIWDEHSAAMEFSISSPARPYYMALADLLAAEIAPHYMVAGPDRTRALMRLRAILLPDDRTDPRDLNSDRMISDAEAATGQRAVYY